MPLIDAFGARWTLDVSGLDDALAGELLHLWDRAVVDPAPGDPEEALPFVVRRVEPGRVEVDGTSVATPDADVPYLVSRTLTVASIRRRAGSCLMLHAAGLAGDTGGTVALVAASGAGKTTAARLLGRHLGYVSDETITIEHDLTVRPYPKPLSILADPSVPGSKHERSPDDLGLLRPPPSLHLAAVVVLDRRDDATVPRLEPIGLTEAMADVLPQTSALPGMDRPLDRLARALAQGHGPYRLVYSHIEDCLDLVTDLAHVGQGHAVGDVTWSWFDGLDHLAFPTPVPDDLGPSTVVRRTSFRDAVSSDGDVLVMRDWTPVTLPGLAGTMWLNTAAPVAVSDLVIVAEDELGPHPDAERIVVETVRLLIDERILHTV